MEHLLDIIIPEYNCKESDMKNLLDSIIRQKKVNLRYIGVIIVNDCSSNKLKKSLFRNYPQLDINYYIKDVNEGVGMTRQYGLDKSTAQYVTFVDQDDELYGNDTLFNVFDFIQKNNPDLIVSSYYEEVLTEEGIKKFLHTGYDATEAVHGVFVRRDSILKNGIKFIPGIKYHDDYYYKRILTTLMNPLILNEVTYLWKYNYDSVVRKKRKHDYSIETFGDFLKALRYKIEFLKSKNAFVCDNTLASILGAFIVLESNNFDDEELIDDKKKYEYELYKLICENSDLISVEMDRFDEIYNNQYSCQKYHFKILDVNESFFDFLNRMSKEYPDYVFDYNRSDKILDVIVPYYNVENVSIIKFLNSFLYQRNYKKNELGIIIINDKSDTNIPDSYLQKDYSKLNIQYYKKEKCDGLGNACQYGIDKSDARFVLFLNPRSELYDNFTICNIITTLKNFDGNILCTNFYKCNEVIDQNNEQSIYGLICRRSYLNDTNITFNNELSFYNEQFFFMINSLISDMKKSDAIIFIDRNKIDETELLVNYFDDYFKSVLSALKFSIGKNIKKILALKYFYSAYLILESNLFYDVNIDKYENDLLNLYHLMIESDTEASYEKNKEIYNLSISYVRKKYKIREIRKDIKEFLSPLNGNNK